MKGMLHHIRQEPRVLANFRGIRGVAVLTLALGLGGALSSFRADRAAPRPSGPIPVLSAAYGPRAARVATLDLSLPPAREEADKARRVVFLNALFTRIRQLPGIVDVGGTTCQPLPDHNWDGSLARTNAGELLPETERGFEKLFDYHVRSGSAEYCAATAGYFRALGIPLLRGRFFDARDTLDAPHVALISESLARLKWPGQNPIGKQLEFGSLDGDSRLLTIVGIVGDLPQDIQENPPGPTIYVNYAQRPQSAQSFVLVMRSTGEVASLFPSAFRTRRPDPAASLRYE